MHTTRKAASKEWQYQPYSIHTKVTENGIKQADLLLMSVPYDPSTLQHRIQREILGLGALSDYLVELKKKLKMVPVGDDTVVGKDKDDRGNVDSSLSFSKKEAEAVKQPATEMIRVRLDEEFWVDMTHDQIDSFMQRKSACKSFPLLSTSFPNKSNSRPTGLIISHHRFSRLFF